MRSSRLAVRVIWGAVGLQVLLIALEVLFAGLQSARSGLDSLLPPVVEALVTLAFPAVGAVILLHRPDHRVGRLFSASGMGFCLSNCCGAYVRYDVAVHAGALPGLSLAASLYYWPSLLSVGLIALLLLMFPNGSLPSARWRIVAWPVAAAALCGAIGSALASGPVDTSIGLMMANPLGLSEPWGSWMQFLGGLAQMLLFLLFIGVAASLVARWRGSGPLERQQLKWLMSAAVAWAILIVGSLRANTVYPTPWTMPAWAAALNELGILGGILIPIACGVAILRYHLYDIDVIIRRTLVYSLLTAVLAAAYLGSVVVLQEATGRVFGARQNELVTVASTLVIAGLFVPVRRRIQNQVDRRFYRRKYDAAQTLARFGATVRDEVDLDLLAGELVGVVRETMQPEHLSLWLHARGQR